MPSNEILRLEGKIKKLEEAIEKEIKELRSADKKWKQYFLLNNEEIDETFCGKVAGRLQKVLNRENRWSL